jgi:methionine aminotransferase
MEEIPNIHHCLVVSGLGPMQVALAAILENPDGYLGLVEFYQRKRDILLTCMTESRLDIKPCSSGFFMLARFSDFSNQGDRDFVFALLREMRVGTIPLSSFYGDGMDTGMIRLGLCKGDDTLCEGGRALSDWRP